MWLRETKLLLFRIKVGTKNKRKIIGNCWKSVAREVGSKIRGEANMEELQPRHPSPHTLPCLITLPPSGQNLPLIDQKVRTFSPHLSPNNYHCLLHRRENKKLENQKLSIDMHTRATSFKASLHKMVLMFYNLHC